MVLFQTVRSGLYLVQGKIARASVLSQYIDHCGRHQIAVRRNKDARFHDDSSPSAAAESVRLPWTVELRQNVYVGLRTGSHIPYNHVNHARFAEAMELGRWHWLGVHSALSRCWAASLYPTVQSIDIQYLNEMPMLQRIVSRVQFWGATIDGKAVNCLQQLESLDGRIIYASGIARMAWVNFPSYAKRQRRDALALSSLPPTGGGGAVPVAEAMQRLGYDADEIESFMAFQPIDGIDEAFSIGQHVGKTSASCSQEDSLRKTFALQHLRGVNDADSEWRHSLAREQRARRMFFSKK